MSIVIISPERDPKKWVEAVQEQEPGIPIAVYPNVEHPEEIDYAITWKHPRGIFKKYPNLKVIASMGAGVDHITSDPEISKDLIVTKIVDDQLSKDMSSFVLSLVMDKIRNISHHHMARSWEPQFYKQAEDEQIGIMGLGILGKAVAEKLINNDFKVSGWAKTKKHIPGVHSYHGEKELNAFLKQTTLLVCLLPLTAETENILNKELFELLPKGAFVINVARGEHLVEHDLLEMIDKQHLSGASLDVFRNEPLPLEHPFWNHPKVYVTPHIASVTDPKKVVGQLLENYKRMRANLPLKNKVVLEKGY